MDYLPIWRYQKVKTLLHEDGFEEVHKKVTVADITFYKLIDRQLGGALEYNSGRAGGNLNEPILKSWNIREEDVKASNWSTYNPRKRRPATI